MHIKFYRVSLILVAVMAALTVGLVSDKHQKGSMLCTYFMVLFSPITILNSSAWAQCDSIYVFWAIASLYALCNKKYAIALILLGMSFAFKLQAVFILPFFLYVYFAEKKFSIVSLR